MKLPEQPLLPLNESRIYAVLLPLAEGQNGPELVLEKRSSKLKHQPGDLCFPGGKAENEEPSEAAVRETAEELQISPEQIEITRSLPGRIGPDGCAVWPFIAKLKDYRDTYSPAEVERVIRIPVETLKRTEPEIWHADMVLNPEEDFPLRREWTKKPVTIYLYRIEDAVIWGLTAQILYDFLMT